jgi:16S rRNA (cytosine967-C5)-methyltransferase
VAAPTPSAREAAVIVLARVDAGEAFANLLLTATLNRARLSPADAGLVYELVLGVLRHRARLDWTLGGALRHPLDRLTPRIRAILRCGVYQLLFLPRIPAHAAVDEAVTLARRHGHAGTAKLVNAVLRRVAADGERPLPAEPPAERLAIEHSHPRWLVDRWLARFGSDDAVSLCAANNAPGPATIRVNVLRGHPDEAVRRLHEGGVTATPTLLPEGWYVQGPLGPRQAIVAEGLATAQDLGAMLVTHLLDPQPGEVVIDAAAAPGGKATHIAERMRDRGRVIACDVHPGKLQRLSRRASVMGLQALEAHHQDARTLGQAFRHQAHRLLLDAPCTGFGVVRRRPEIKWRARPEDIAHLAALQREMLAGAADALRPGGILVYSVCTIEEEEGQNVIAEFLRAHPEFVRDPDLPLPGPLGTAVIGPGEVRLLPHRHGTDGFYIARLRRHR